MTRLAHEIREYGGALPMVLTDHLDRALCYHRREIR